MTWKALTMLLMHAGRQANGLPLVKLQATTEITEPLVRLHSAPVMVQHSSPSGLRSIAELQESSHESTSRSSTPFTSSSSVIAQLGTSHGTADQALPPVADSRPHAALPPRAQPPPRSTECIHEKLGRAASVKATSAFQGTPPHQLDGLGHPTLPLVSIKRLESAADLPTWLQSVPASFHRSDMLAMHQAPSRQQSSLSAAGTAQKAASLSRRTSLANMLLRMSVNSERGNSEHQTIVTTSSVMGMSNEPHGSTLVPLDRAASIHAKLAPFHTDNNQGGVTRHALPSATEQAAADHTDPATELKRLYSLAAELASPPDSPLAPIRQPSLRPVHPDIHSDIILAACSSSQDSASGHRVKRTLSDRALEALCAVENLKCPVIEYKELQIVRKIGEGSIGQVNASSLSYSFHAK